MTAQVSERLLIDGQELSMEFCPPRPIGHPRLRKRSKEEIGKLLERARGSEDPAELGILFSTGCRRMYRAGWQVKRLHVTRNRA